ncbi:MAG: inositol monophosphatase family protein [Victivallaceae bacterium]|nr:inositol monophosphatase family protein [Victivallaceae bacterium]
MTTDFSSFIKKIALAAGRMTLAERKRLSERDIAVKATVKDIVTAADRRVEEYLVGEILNSFPHHGIFGEETGETNPGAAYCWVIDPIDGTTSFVHNLYYYSVSIALQQSGRTIAAGVYAPVLDELFLSDEKHGATLNGEAITVSGRTKLIDCVLATGFACVRADLSENNLKYFARVIPEIRDVRRFGSAALDLCYVACGRLDGFWELNLQPYDMAAGAFIAETAGGRMTDLDGGGKVPGNGTVVTNRLIHAQLLHILHGI